MQLKLGFETLANMRLAPASAMESLTLGPSIYSLHLTVIDCCENELIGTRFNYLFFFCYTSVTPVLINRITSRVRVIASETLKFVQIRANKCWLAKKQPEGVFSIQFWHKQLLFCLFELICID